VNRNRKRRGFTLLEVLLVLAILVVLAGVVAFTLGNTLENSKAKADRIKARDTIPERIDRYRLDYGQLPATLNDLLVAGPKGGPYCKQQEITDSWERPFSYRPISATEYLVYSSGANGVDEGGGGDDLSNQQQTQ